MPILGRFLERGGVHTLVLGPLWDTGPENTWSLCTPDTVAGRWCPNGCAYACWCRRGARCTHYAPHPQPHGHQAMPATGEQGTHTPVACAPVVECYAVSWLPQLTHTGECQASLGPCRRRRPQEWDTPTAGSPSAQCVCGEDDARSGLQPQLSHRLTLEPDLTFSGPASHLVSDGLVTLISSCSTQQPLAH